MGDRMKENFHLARGFLIASAAILVPLLLMSLWASNHTIGQLEKETYQAMQASVERAADEVAQLYVEYKGRAAAMSTDDVIRTDFWLQNPSRYHATQNLERIAAYSSVENIVFLQTPEGDVFSSRGFSRADTFFEVTLKLDAASVSRVKELLNVQSAGAALLTRNNPTDGYFLLRYPLLSSGIARSMTANFLLPFSALTRVLQGLTNEYPVYAQLSLADGSSLCCLLNDERTAVLSSLPEAQMDAYTAIQQAVPTLDATLTVHYDPDSLYRSVRQFQALNMALLAAGLLLSAFISFYFTARRTRSLKRLEALAEGRPVAFRFQDEYAFIGNLLTNSAHKISTLSTHIEDYSEIIRQQNVMLILNGAVRDRKTANRLLNASGQELTEEYFFIGVIRADELSAQAEEIGRLMKNEMFCFLDGQKSAAFLWETPNRDESGEIRRETARHFLSLLESTGVPHAFVGMSRVYQELSMAELAFREAMETAGKAKEEGNVLCYEELDHDGPLSAQVELENLHLLTDALKERDGKKALLEFERLNRQIARTPSGEGERAYLRYCILRALLSAVEEESAQESVLQSAVKINFQDRREFSDEVEKLIAQYTGGKEKKAAPEEIQKYLMEHYTNPDLSAADVAEFAGINKAHLGMIFKQHFGMTYIEYLSDLRLEKARELLAETDEPITKIAQEVGYYDHSSFRRKFRAHYGIGVAEFRESVKPAADGRGLKHKKRPLF